MTFEGPEIRKIFYGSFHKVSNGNRKKKKQLNESFLCFEFFFHMIIHCKNKYILYVQNHLLNLSLSAILN